MKLTHILSQQCVWPNSIIFSWKNNKLILWSLIEVCQRWGRFYLGAAYRNYGSKDRNHSFSSPTYYKFLQKFMSGG
ncbi:hypothetical protein CMV_013971 [Castanea mollissima]|uniref:Uncharacterized protein n=1 Tax=Castanea mollissima TaxID=60419 RepID=A0A8J4RCH5_9ROSI|nr:hypothetical protein CMV_013971 [Castanea mollissima]